MITSLRLHGQREASPVQPTTLAYADHQLAIQELTKAYEAKLAAAGGGAPVGDGPTEDDMKAAIGRIGELEALLAAAHDASEADKAKLAELQSQLESSNGRLAELEALLESVTSAPAPEPTPEAVAETTVEAPAEPVATEKASTKDEAKRPKR